MTEADVDDNNDDAQHYTDTEVLGNKPRPGNIEDAATKARFYQIPQLSLPPG